MILPHAHITRIQGDCVNVPLLGMTKVVGEDSACNGLKAIEENEGVSWLQKHLYQSYNPLLELPWILDADVTIKTLYGHQEEATIGYNPHKLGQKKKCVIWHGNVRKICHITHYCFSNKK